MRTVKSLKAELSKFPDDALAYAYEGEIRGLVINSPDERIQEQGAIYCGESSGEEPDTEVPTWAKS